jgi:predicted  nucleic acid-binding Zn-ribbon protein
VTKRERETIARKLTKIEQRVAKKRDELRECVREMDGLLESISAADEEVEGVLYNLRSAREALDRGVADKLSEYV